MRCFNIMRVDWFLVMIALAFGHFHQIINRVAGDFAKNRVFFVQVVCRAKSDEELRAVVVFTAVSHRYETSSDETELERIGVKLRNQQG